MLPLKHGYFLGVYGDMFNLLVGILAEIILYPAIYTRFYHHFFVLNHRDLSANQLLTWEGNFTNELTSLKHLDVSNNTNFSLPTGLLKLRELREIRGVTWSESCANCMLVRNYTLENGKLNDENINITTSRLLQGEYIVGKRENCRVNKLKVTQTVVEYAKHGFFPKCLVTDTTCYHSQIRVTPTHRCWDLDNKILNAVYIISPIAMMLNLTVVLITLTTRVLRKNVTMLLTCNMAVSDFLLSVYTVILVSTRKMPYTEFLLILDDLCNAMGFIWLTGQIVSVKTSLLLTIERFLAIVYCMKPSVRMTRRQGATFAALTWCLGMSVAILPLLKISVYTSNTYCIPIRPIRDIPHSYEMSIALSIWGMIVYFVIVPFYVKIFWSVKKTSQRAGVNRDGAVARKIAALVLSNMLFFFFPIVIAFMWLITNLKETMSPQDREILTGVLPTLLFSFNAFINPLLYAFRADKFKKVLKMRINTICLRKPRAGSSSTSYSRATTVRRRNPTLPSTPRLNTTPPLSAKDIDASQMEGNGCVFSRI